MRRIAWIYIYGVLLTAGIISTAAYFMRTNNLPPLWLFATLTLVCSLMRIFVIEAPRHRSYEGSTIILVTGLWLLPFWLYIALVIISHAVEWVKERWTERGLLRNWYIQPFNMAKAVISGSSSLAIINLFSLQPGLPISQHSLLMTLLTLVVYVAVNQGLLAIALYLARGISFQQAGILRDGLLIEMPLASIGYIAVELSQISPLLVFLVLAPIILIYQAFMLPKLQDEAIRSLESFNEELTAANQAIRQVNDELFWTLAKVFDARDPFVGGHAAQVATYAVAIAQELGLADERVETIRQSALLHDIGKIAIPESILHKPSKLTTLEYEFLKKHTDIGADFIETSHGLRHLAPFIRHHHERWDGRGYPAGLAGEAIPLEARILNVCDSVEAMASDRPYSRAMSVEEIIKEVVRCSGGQFDPTVAKAFVRIAEREGAQLVVNSARAVVAQYAEHEWDIKGLKLEHFAEIYGMATA